MAITQAQRDFVSTVGASASADMGQRGVLASLTVAQAILESGWGTSALATKANALFGIKADSRWGGRVYNAKTQECYDGVAFTEVDAAFRAYDSWEQSLADHAAFLAGSPRYQAVIGETDYTAACTAIKAAGYATDPAYAEKLISLIETYDLTAFDAVSGKEGNTMNLHKLIFVNNACYKAGRTITPKGIMVHSTGANNPNLKRYVGPDDGSLGKNQYGNHWNQDKPDGRQVCVHGFIGKLADGSIATYQTLPWNHRGWHCGSGSKGSGNDTHLSFEICEDGLTDAAYFGKVYLEAAELCAYLCKQYGLTEKNIICHSEGYAQGIASNHGDVMHWWPKHGKNMETFRAEVKKLLANGTPSIPAPAPVPTAPTAETMYRVRKAWSDAASQKGAFKVLENAKKCADQNIGYSVFDETGTKIYGGAADAAYSTYVVVKGDSLWKIAAAKLGSGARYPEIKSFNGLISDTIYAGQKLKIPNK
jgi:LysM repeat protein